MTCQSRQLTQTIGQVMVLTHEDASDEEKMPYMALRCHPLVVKEFFGRAAKKNAVRS